MTAAALFLALHAVQILLVFAVLFVVILVGGVIVDTVRGWND